MNDSNITALDIARQVREAFGPGVTLKHDGTRGNPVYALDGEGRKLDMQLAALTGELKARGWK